MTMMMFFLRFLVRDLTANAMTPDEMLRAYAERKKSVYGYPMGSLPMMASEMAGSTTSLSQHLQQQQRGVSLHYTGGSVRSLTG